MAMFRRNPFGQGWLIVDLPEGTKVGDTVAVPRRDGTIASILVGEIRTYDGRPVAVPARKARGKAATPATCPNCGHSLG